jgi:hypothetical protein
MSAAQPLLLQLPFPPEALPAVDPSQLMRAWQAATLGAETGLLLQPGDIEGVIFRWEDGEARFLFADLDASCWAAALDRLYGLNSATGIAVLFRLLALIDLIARAPWIRPLVRLGHRDGVVLDPEVLHLAASRPLTPSARFDADAFKDKLGDRVSPSSGQTPRGTRRLGKV